MMLKTGFLAALMAGLLVPPAAPPPRPLSDIPAGKRLQSTGTAAGIRGLQAR